MAKFQFTQRHRSQDDLRTDDAVEFMTLMQEAFHVPGWLDAEDQPVTLSSSAIESTLRSLVSQPDLSRFGVTWVVKSSGDEALVVLKMAMGGDEWSPNFFTVDFSRTSMLPDLRYFRQSIKATHPFEAFILEEDNERALRQQLSHKPPSDRPRLLRWFHYMNSELVEMIGGMQHCLKMPAFMVEQFCNGILFQLTDAPFDAESPQHKNLQLEAIRHLGLE